MQLALGSYLVFLMDEVVSKWGLGSGISLFIAAGVSQSLFTGLLNWVPEQGIGSSYSALNPPSGVLPKTFYLLYTYSSGELINQGGFERILLTGSNSVIALIATLLTFFLVVYAESSRVELPLAHGRVRGARGRYPIRLLYASNIPVILAGALLANVNLIGLLLWSGPLSNLPLLGGAWLRTHAPDWQGAVGGYQPGSTRAITGFAYYFSAVNGVQEWLLPFIGANPTELFLRQPWQIWLHMLIYGTFMIGGSILFAIFWIETTNMGPSDVARQIEKSGMQIPGFRRDPRVTGKILERYIPVVTVIGGAAVGGLAMFADLLGTLGNASGTGVLLTVGILQRMYEQIAKEQAMEMHPILRGFFGEG
jgi:preprotein translocase subunit SecY